MVNSLNNMLIVCGINNTALQQLTFPHIPYSIQAWETADSNLKDLQKLQGVIVNCVVKTEQPITTKPNKGGNSSSISSNSCKHFGGQHPTSECKYK